MLRRIICFLLVLSVMVAGASVASATSVPQNPLIDLYQYNFGISAISGSYSYFTGWEFGVSNGTLTFPLAASSAVYYVDIVLALGNGWLPSLAFKVFDSSLTAVYFGPYNNYVRIYGPVVSSLASNSSITLSILQPSSDFMLYGSVLSFKYSPTRELYYDLSARGQVSTENGYFPTLSFNYPSSASVNQATEGYFPYIFSIYCDEWKVYDFLSFIIEVDSYEMTSIVVGDGSFLYSVEYLLDAYGDSRQRFIVTVDLTQADRSNSSFFIRIFGTCKAESTASLPLNSFNTWSLVGVSGSFKASAPSAEISWLDKIWNAVTDGFNKLIGDDDSMGDFAGDAQQQAGELQEGNEAMNQVEKPELDQGSADISTIIAPDDLVNTTSWLSDILNAKYISQIMTLAMTLTLASYVLFGKKG